MLTTQEKSWAKLEEKMRNNLREKINKIMSISDRNGRIFTTEDDRKDGTSIFEN